MGIATTFNNRLFRSRLEARWAAFYDRLKWEWEYEPFDLEGWIPDFALYLGGQTYLVEVKPDDLWTPDQIAKARRALTGSAYPYALQCAERLIVQPSLPPVTCLGRWIEAPDGVLSGSPVPFEWPFEPAVDVRMAWASSGNDVQWLPGRG
jgi:hypothetical protein